MANKNGKHLQHLRSNILNRIPKIEMLDYGEIAINYAANGEKIFIKNSNDEIISFSSDELRIDGETQLPIIICYNELPLDKKENVLYLLCLEESIKKYIYNNNEWKYIGDLSFNLNNFYTKAECDNIFLTKSDLKIVNELGNSTDKILSQKTTTEALNTKPNFPPNDGISYCMKDSKWIKVESSSISEVNEIVQINFMSNHLKLLDFLKGKTVQILSSDNSIINEKVIDDNHIIEFSVSENTQYKLHLPQVENFFTPIISSFTAIGGNIREINLIYKIREVKVSVENMIDNNFTLYINNISFDINNNNNVIIEYCPINKPCHVILKRNSDDVILYAKSFTTEDDINIQIDAQLKLENVIFIEQSQNQPIISGDVNGDIIRNIRENSHRVLGKKTDENTMSYIELDDTNSNYYFDGTEANLNGDDGDVFVKLPTFYYKGVNNDEDHIEIHISYQKLDNDFIKWDGNKLIGAYELSKKDDKYYSCSNNEIAKISSIISPNRGSGYTFIDWQAHNIIGMLFIIYYGKVDSQSVCGSGITDLYTTTGLTNSLGMLDTDVISGNDSFVNFWGLECWWGKYYEYIADFRNYEVKDEDNGTTRDVRRLSNELDRVPLKLYFGRYIDLIPVSDDGTTDINNGYCDYMTYYGGISYIHQVYMLRSSYKKGRENGIFSIHYKVDDDFFNTTSRLCFYGLTQKITDVETYKSLVQYE